GEVLAHLLFDGSLHFRGNQFVLGLGAEFWIRNLDRNDRGQAFPGIVTGGSHLVLLRQTFGFDVVVQVARQRRPKARKVRTAVTLRDVVGEAKNVLVEAVIPLQRYFNANTVFLALDAEVENLVDRRLVGVQVIDKGAQS